MRFKVIYVYVFLSIICSCQTSKDGQSDVNEIEKNISEKNEIIEIDPRKFNENELVLSDFVSDIIYIPLSNQLFLGHIIKMEITKNAIYVVADAVGTGGEGNGNRRLFRFEKNGNNPVQIGRIGKGPEEYLDSKNFVADEKRGRVYINGRLNTILVYDIKGSYIRDFKLNDDNGRVNQMSLLGDNLFMAEQSLGANTKYLWTITDTLGNELAHKNNSTQAYKTRTGSRGGISQSNGQILYWVSYNDTVFKVFPDFSFRTSYIITPGEHRVPKKDLPVNLELPLRLLEYYSPHYFIETKHYLLSRYNYKGKFAYLFLDKDTNKTFISYFESKKDVRGGIANNFDGGLMFCPDGYFEEGENEYLLDCIQPYELKQHIISDAFVNINPKYPEKKKALENLANSLNEYDNPILMLVKLKE